MRSNMTYEEFKAEYLSLVKLLTKYSPEVAGSSVYASKLADLTDKYPEFEKRIDSEELSV